MLLPKANEPGRVMASEVLIVTPAIRNLIREQKAEQIYLAIQTGVKYGMQTMNQSLGDICRKKFISYQQAINTATDAEEIKRLLQTAGLKIR